MSVRESRFSLAPFNQTFLFDLFKDFRLFFCACASFPPSSAFIILGKKNNFEKIHVKAPKESYKTVQQVGAQIM